jgi:hypothetical protein
MLEAAAEAPEQRARGIGRTDVPGRVRLYRGREVIRHGAGGQRYQASPQRYDRDEVIDPRGTLPSVRDGRPPRVPRRPHLNGAETRPASQRSRGPPLARPLSVEAIGERDLSAALAPEACAFRVPHRERSDKHRSVSALLAHEDDPPRRTVHLPTPSSALATDQQIGTPERRVRRQPPSS